MSAITSHAPMTAKRAGSHFAISVDKHVLVRLLSHVQSVVERRNTIAILSNVLLVAEHDALTVTATDMDLMISETKNVSVGGSGSVTVPAHLLYDIIRKLPDTAPIHIALSTEKNGFLVITTGQCEFFLPCLPSEEFPRIDHAGLPFAFSMTVDECKKWIDQTRYAIATEETRYYLNGIYMHADPVASPHHLNFVATDGHRLSHCRMAVASALQEGVPSVIIPRKAIQELRKLLDEMTGLVAISFSANKICFQGTNSLLLTKLIDGAYPDYTQVIPMHNQQTLTLSRTHLQQAVDRVSVMASERGKGIRFAIYATELVLTASADKYGTATEKLSAHYDGEPMEIGFNPRYILDALSVVTSDDVSLVLGHSASSVILKAPGQDDTVAVIMPMRV